MPGSLTLIFRNAVRNRRRRAIVTDPDIILADELTSNLDAASAKEALRLLEKLNRDFGKTIVMVTHDPHAARYALKIRHLEKGVLLPEGPLPDERSECKPYRAQPSGDEWIESSDRAEGTWLHSSRG